MFLIIYVFTSCSWLKFPQEETEPSLATPAVTYTSPLDSVKTSQITQPEKEVNVYNEYNITLDISPKERLITGVEKVRYQNTTDIPLEKMYFHLYLNAFAKFVQDKPYFSQFENKIFQNGKDYGYINVSNVLINKEDQAFEVKGTILQIELAKPLKKDESIEITLQFEAYIPAINHRTGANNKAMWFGNFLPILSVYDHYGWHNHTYYPAGDPFYSEIANYTVTVKTPIEYIVAGTGVESVSESENKKITTLSARFVRDLAFAVSDAYQKDSIKTNSGIEIHMYHYSDIDTGRFLDTARKALDYYSQRVGSYPYEQLDIVETGFFISGGMEYPQLVFMDSDYLKKEESYRSLAHEIGHQWFYNIIGNDQVKEAWLDEGLTMLVQEGIFFDRQGLHAKMNQDYQVLKTKLNGIENKGLLSDLSVYKNWSEYYNVQYTRGKLMMYSLMLKMGEEKFDEFLKTYYSQYAYKTVGRREFIKLSEEIYGALLTDFFDAWMGNYDLPPLSS